MRISPFTKSVTIDDARFFLQISYQAKRGFAECVKLGDLAKGATDPESVQITLSDLELGRLVDVLVNNRCVIGWEGVEIENESGEVKPLPFSQENMRSLDFSTLIELATHAMNFAFQSRGNAGGSESK